MKIDDMIIKLTPFEGNKKIKRNIFIGTVKEFKEKCLPSDWVVNLINKLYFSDEDKVEYDIFGHGATIEKYKG